MKKECLKDNFTPLHQKWYSRPPTRESFFVVFHNSIAGDSEVNI